MENYWNDGVGGSSLWLKNMGIYRKHGFGSLFKFLAAIDLICFRH